MTLGVVAGILSAVAWPRAGWATPAWQPAGESLNETRFKMIAVSPVNSRLLYAGSARAIYRSVDGGVRWREQFRVPASAELTSVALDPFDPRHVLAATTTGVYGSSNEGRRWRRIFRASGEGASRCHVVAFHPLRRHEIFVGTAGGLFISEDGGARWRKLGPHLSNRSILNLTVDPQDPARLYALTDEGLFVGSVDGQRWERRFDVGALSEEGPEDAEEALEEPGEESGNAPRLTAMAIDQQEPHHWYLASLGGLFVSEDGGSGWRRLTQRGLGTEAIRHLILHAHSPTVVYAATPQGVARYDPHAQKWEALYAGLPTQAVHFLTATETKVFAATDQGLYRLDLAPEQLAQETWPSAGEILANFVHEPTIGQVQTKAIQYAEVQPEKIQRWRRQAYLKALLPSFNIDYDRDQDTYLNAIGSTTTRAFDRIIHASDPSRSFGLSVSWDLGDLVWNDDQTSIDTRSKLMVQLRDDILDEATRNFFERRRLQLELMTDPPDDPRAQLEKELRIQELTAMLDGLTGGWFSKHIERNGKRR